MACLYQLNSVLENFLLANTDLYPQLVFNNMTTHLTAVLNPPCAGHIDGAAESQPGQDI